MSGIRDTYPTWASVPAHIQRAVNAYDDARRQDSPWEWAMSERNKTSIAPMIEAAIEAAKPPPGADSGLAAADDNPQRDVPRDEEGRDAYQIIAEGNRQAMLRRAGVKDRSREPLLGPPSDMLVSRILLEALPDVDPKRADQLAVKINDALPADDNHKALVEALTDQLGWLETVLMGSDFTKPRAGQIVLYKERVEQRRDALRQALAPLTKETDHGEE